MELLCAQIAVKWKKPLDFNYNKIRQENVTNRCKELLYGVVHGTRVDRNFEMKIKPFSRADAGAAAATTIQHMRVEQIKSMLQFTVYVLKR